ncbi:MAG: amidohydrolase [Eubacteriales bacterium]|nr:amidohydrolase [Eubacteriales bacterium]
MKILIKDVTAALRTGKGKYSTVKTDICIEGGKIVSVGNIQENYLPDKVINGAGLLALPGLINAHTHVYMTCLRGIADDLPFDEWLFGRILPNEDKLTAKDAYASSLLGCAEMLKSGTTAFLDMHMFPGKSAEAALKTGMRACLSRGLVGSGDDEAGSTRLKQAKAEIAKYGGYDTLSFMLAPHSIYTTDAEYLKKVSEEAKKLNLPLHIHVSESLREVEDCRKKHSKSPVKYLEDLGVFENKVTAAHCVHISDEDIEILAKHNVNVALCPRSNLKLGNGIAPVKKLLDRGINLCVGTDSAASNNTLNLFPDMSLTTLLHKGANMDASAVTAGEVLDMATCNGAKALGINSGELAVGKNADIVMLNTNLPQLEPKNDLISSLCYSANGSEVDTVIINGEIVLKNGRLTKINEKSVCANSEIIIERLIER